MIKKIKNDGNKCVCGETKTLLVYDAQGNLYEICANVLCKRIRSKQGWLN